jgi:hypothetical protein
VLDLVEDGRPVTRGRPESLGVEHVEHPSDPVVGRAPIEWCGSCA